MGDVVHGYLDLRPLQKGVRKSISEGVVFVLECDQSQVRVVPVDRLERWERKVSKGEEGLKDTYHAHVVLRKVTCS